MPTISQEKKPTEKIRISVDFANVLEAGDALIGGNCAVTSSNALTDASSTATIVSTVAVSGTSVIATVQNGTSGEIHKVTFSTGNTALALSYESQITLIITDSPAAENPLISLNDAKIHLGVTDSSDDRLIESLILAGSAYIRRRCGRDFTFLTYTEVLQPLAREDRVRMQLSHYPVKQIDRIRTYDSEGTLIADTSNPNDWDYMYEGYVWFMNELYSFEPWPGRNEITYRAGFPRIPDDLARCCAQLVAILYRQIGKEGVSEERIGQYMYRTSTPKDMPKSLRRELNDSYIEGVITRYMRHDLEYVGF